MDALRRALSALAVVLPLSSIGLAVQAAELQALSAPDDSWVRLSGTVESATGDAFTLDFGNHDIVVEMDDWNWYGEGSRNLTGKRAVVSGRIDDDFFEKRSIEASSVYVDGAYYYASARDEEIGRYSSPPDPLSAEEDWVAMRGVVKSTAEDSFVLGTGGRTIKVNVAQMRKDPLDSEGYRQVERGDLVSVHGKLDNAALFERRELNARGIAILIDDDRLGQ